MLRYFRTFLFGLALVLSMTQVPAVTMGQTNSHQIMNHATHSNMAKSLFADGSVSTMTHDMTNVVMAQDTECTENASCVHCATNMACVSHCAASIGVPSFPVHRLLIGLSDEYLVSMRLERASFFNQPNTPPPKALSFS